jgi:DNA-binding NarL/FixJ family response regulator
MKRILIIEDEPQVRANLATILEMEGYAPATASHGAEGIALAREEAPDLILCDITMPEADGYAVLATLRADPALANIPFVFLTAKSTRADVRLGMNLGADDYLTKPFVAPELLSAVEARLKRAASQVKPAPVFTAQRLESLGLTPREAEVLFWLAQGKANSDIATILDLSMPTVKTHLAHIFDKLGVENRTSAVVRALETMAA